MNAVDFTSLKITRDGVEMVIMVFHYTHTNAAPSHMGVNTEPTL